MGFFIYLVKLTDPSVCGLIDVNSRSSCWVRAFCGQLWAKGEVEKREGPEAVSWESGCSPTCSQNSSKKALQICHLPSGFGSSCKGHSLLSLFLWIPGHPEQSTVMCEEDGLVNWGLVSGSFGESAWHPFMGQCVGAPAQLQGASKGPRTLSWSMGVWVGGRVGWEDCSLNSRQGIPMVWSWIPSAIKMRGGGGTVDLHFSSLGEFFL